MLLMMRNVRAPCSNIQKMIKICFVFGLLLINVFGSLASSWSRGSNTDGDKWSFQVSPLTIKLGNLPQLISFDLTNLVL